MTIKIRRCVFCQRIEFDGEFIEFKVDKNLLGRKSTILVCEICDDKFSDEEIEQKGRLIA